MRAAAEAAVSMFAILLALAATFAAFGLPVGASLRGVVAGAVGDPFALGRTAAKATPLLLASLGIAAAWRAGAYNVGGEGQFVVGAAAAAAIAFAPYGGATLALLAAVAGGAAWAGIAAGLRRWRGADVILTTILLNSIAFSLLLYLVSGPLRDPATTSPITRSLAPDRMLWRADRRYDLHAGFFIALAAVPIFDAFFRFTRAGFVQRLAGESPGTARANRLDAERARAHALMVSGAMCGLAGGIEFLGVTGQIAGRFDAGWGFVAIPVALMGGRSAYGVAAVALLSGALFAGADDLSRTAAGGATMVYVAQAVALLGVLASRRLLNRERSR